MCQHSALSTQHSALSTQMLKYLTNKVRATYVTILLLLFANFSFAYQVIDTEPGRYYEDSFGRSVSSQEVACQVYLSDAKKFFAWYTQSLGRNYSVEYLGYTTYLNEGSGGNIIGYWSCNLNLFVDGIFQYRLSQYDMSGHILASCPQGVQLIGIEVEGKPKKVCRVIDYSNQINILTLTPAPNQAPPDPRPKGTEGKDPKSSTHELIAKVMEGGTPKAGVAVTFKVEVKEGSGEHGVTGGAVHDHRVRKEKHSGEIKPLSVTTTASGEIRIKFEAPILAGTHTVTATCETCSNKTVTKDVKVLVPNLVALTADTGTPKMFSLVGNTGDPGANHPDNHYFTAAAKLTLTEGVIPKLFNAGWGIVGVNDGSLHDGGLFDLQGQWNTIGGHAGHRTGTEVDIRTNDKSEKTVREGYNNLCSKENSALDVQTLWHKKDAYGPHFHIYLSGIGLRADAIGGCCAQVMGPKKDKDGKPLLDKKGNPIMGAICE